MNSELTKAKTIEDKSELVQTDREITEFLKAQKLGTRRTYSTYFKRILEFSNENGKDILANRKQWERKIFALDQYLKDKGYSPYYCESVTGCLRGYFSYFRKPLQLTGTEKKRLKQRQRTTQDYYLTNDDLYKMWLCGTVKARYVVAVGKSLGLRAEDFSRLTYGHFRKLDLTSEAPIFLGEIETEKESVKAYCFLDKDAIESVKQLLAQSTQKPDNEEIWKARSEDLSPLLRRLADKAHIQNGTFRIRFHCLRKFLADNLSRVMSESKWKQVIGKQISEGAYVSPQTLRDDYKNAMVFIAFNGSATRKKVENLETENERLKTQIAQLETENNQLKGKTSNLELTMNNINERLAHIEKFGKKKPAFDKFR